MNYARIYDQLIERARVRSRPEGYVEHHHVIPRCMGGGDEPDNLVALSAREHYVAHLLLAKEHPNKAELWITISFMTSRKGNRLPSWWYKKSKEACLPIWRETGRKNGTANIPTGPLSKIAGLGGKVSGPKTGRLAVDSGQLAEARKVFWEDKDKTEAHRKIVSEIGKRVGPTFGKRNLCRTVKCECGKISNVGNIAQHQKRTGHIGKEFVS